MNRTKIRKAHRLLDDAIDPKTDDENDPWSQIEEAKDLLDDEIDRTEL